MAELESGRSRGPGDTKLFPEKSASFMSRIIFLSLDRILLTVPLGGHLSPQSWHIIWEMTLLPRVMDMRSG